MLTKSVVRMSAIPHTVWMSTALTLFVVGLIVIGWCSAAIAVRYDGLIRRRNLRKHRFDAFDVLTGVGLIATLRGWDAILQLQHWDSPWLSWAVAPALMVLTMELPITWHNWQRRGGRSRVTT